MTWKRQDLRVELGEPFWPHHQGRDLIDCYTRGAWGVDVWRGDCGDYVIWCQRSDCTGAVQSHWCWLHAPTHERSQPMLIPLALEPLLKQLREKFPRRVDTYPDIV